MENTKDIRNSIYVYTKRLIIFRRFFCYAICLGFYFSGSAQTVDIDLNKALKKKKSFYFTWDSKTTFITNEYAKVKSIKLGVDFGGKTKFGIGYNWYKGGIQRESMINESLATTNLKLRYVSIFAEHVYFLNNRWEAVIPAQIGIGQLSYEKEFVNEKVGEEGGLVMFYEPSSVLIFRFLRYFGAGAGIGFRLSLPTYNNYHQEQLNSPIILIRSKVYFDRVMSDFSSRFGKNRIFH